MVIPFIYSDNQENCRIGRRHQYSSAFDFVIKQITLLIG